MNSFCIFKNLFKKFFRFLDFFCSFLLLLFFFLKTFSLLILNSILNYRKRIIIVEKLVNIILFIILFLNL